MNYKYIVTYSARTADDEGVHGEIHITTEKALETQEELMEIARTIKMEHSEFEEVAINKIVHVI